MLSKKMILAGLLPAFVFLLGLSPQPMWRTESGKVDVPFTPTLPADAPKDILRLFLTANFKLDEARAGKIISDQLTVNRAAIQARDAQYLQNLDARVEQLIAVAQAKVKALMDDRLTTTMAKTCQLLQDDMEKDKPALRITGEYRYQASSRDNGNPGWGKANVELINGRNWGRTGRATFEDVIDLGVPGAAVILPVKIEGVFTLTTSYGAIMPNIEDLSMPQSKAGADPLLEIKAELKMGSENGILGGNGNITQLGGTWKGILKRVSGTIAAVPVAGGSP